MLEISDSARISDKADIENSVRGSRIAVGDHSVIDAFVKIKPVGGKGDVIIGNHSYINSGTVIYSGHGVIIGNNVLIAANCTLAATNHEFGSKGMLIREQGFMPSRGGIVIEDDVWIGAMCVLLDGAILRQGCVIGAGSVVNGEVEAYSVNAGIPLRQIGTRE
jgi:acetyltransferase-like isoleucine patch superfamily enzyme